MSSTCVPSSTETDPRLRLVAEYCDLPGMCLTAAQASRLLQIECPLCAAALDDLVRIGFLRRVGERYAKADPTSHDRGIVLTV